MERKELEKKCADIRVSASTLNYISILKDIDTLYKKIYAQLEKDYGDSGDEMYNKIFDEPLTKLSKETEQFILDSVADDISEQKEELNAKWA